MPPLIHPKTSMTIRPVQEKVSGAANAPRCTVASQKTVGQFTP